MRLILTLIIAFFESKISINDRSIINFYCTVGDGAIKHMRAHKYNNFFNPSLYTLFIRSGKWLDFFKNKMAIVYVKESYQYIKMIKYGKFQTTTQIIHFDEKYFYVKISFFQDENLCAKGYYKMCFVKNNKTYPFSKIKDKIFMELKSNLLDDDKFFVIS